MISRPSMTEFWKTLREYRAHRADPELARTLHIDTERCAIAMGIGGVGAHLRVSADPAEPDDDDPTQERTFFVEVDGIKAGVVNGLETRRYRLTLERLPED